MCNNNECFGNTLHYISPAHGGWGQVRMCMLVPESHQLFVCPFACGRHGAIGSMLVDQKHRLHYLYVTENDIIDGYDDKIIEAVEALLEALETKPKVLFIFVSCLDDLIGTDQFAVIDMLSNIYSDVEFRMCHMNPIKLGSSTAPTLVNYNEMFSLLPKSEHDNSINIMGNFVGIDKESEIYKVFNNINQISDYSTYEGYKNMGKANLNIAISPIAKIAIKTMKRQLGIEHITALVSYDFDVIKENYDIILNKLQLDYDFSSSIQDAKRAIEKTKELVGNTPIVVDCTAVKKPFELSSMLLRNGFNVKQIFVHEILKIDNEAFEYIKENYKDVEIIDGLHHINTVKDYTMEECIAIGFEAAHLTKSKHAVNLFNDEGMYGYYAVNKLMELIEYAADREIELKSILDEYGLVV